MGTSITIESDTYPIADRRSDDDALEYRALYSGAVVGAVLGLLSAMLLFAVDELSSCLALAPIPLLGMFVSLRAWLKIRRNQELYTGGPLALAGLALSALFLVAGVGWSSYIYATEVPEGYERISFLALKPNEIEERAGKPIPDDIAQLVGKRVFIKGYIRPVGLTARHNVDSFLLVRDSNECCFGDINNVKYYDQMQVQLLDPLKTDYEPRLFRVAGTLVIQPEHLLAADNRPVYALAADYIE